MHSLDNATKDDLVKVREELGITGGQTDESAEGSRNQKPMRRSK